MTHMRMNCNMSMGPMQMHFRFGDHRVTVLFEGWEINSVGALVGSFIAIFALALLYEGLKVLREAIHRYKGKFCRGQVRSRVRYQKADSKDDLAAPSYGTINKTPPLCTGIPYSNAARIAFIAFILPLVAIVFLLLYHWAFTLFKQFYT